MGTSVAHICGRGRGGSAQLVTLRCDTDGCSASVGCWSRDELAAAKAAGWRRVDAATGVVACPDHSGAAPAVDVQQELAL